MNIPVSMATVTMVTVVTTSGDIMRGLVADSKELHNYDGAISADRGRKLGLIK